MSGELNFEIDDQRGLVWVTGKGLWTFEQATLHFLELHRAILGLRTVRKQVLVLVDLSEAAVQPNDVAEAVAVGTSRIYRDVDHVALVTATALLSMQMKRAVKVPNLAIFAEVEQAMDWLCAQRERRAG